MLEALPGAHLNRFVYLQAGSAWLKESYAINTVSDAEAIGLPELVETEMAGKNPAHRRQKTVQQAACEWLDNAATSGTCELPFRPCSFL